MQYTELITLSIGYLYIPVCLQNPPLSPFEKKGDLLLTFLNSSRSRAIPLFGRTVHCDTVSEVFSQTTGTAHFIDKNARITGTCILAPSYMAVRTDENQLALV